MKQVKRNRVSDEKDEDADLWRRYVTDFNDLNILMALGALVTGVGYIILHRLGIF